MQSEEFQRSLLREIHNGQTDVSILRELLIDYKNAGMLQKTMYDNLEELRSLCDSNDENIILDLMDFVVGACNQNIKIY